MISSIFWENMHEIRSFLNNIKLFEKHTRGVSRNHLITFNLRRMTLVLIKVFRDFCNAEVKINQSQSSNIFMDIN
jgi:hypothetical protein